MPIGPSLPPHLAHLAQASPPAPSPTAGASDEEEDEDDYGPALPPHLAAARKSTSSSNSVGPAPPSIAGPSRPPKVGPSFPTGPNKYDDDSDSDDEIGPKPIPTTGSGSGAERSAIDEFREREERRRLDAEEKAKPKVLKREEWMLVPPTSGVLSNVDPLRKRPTTFSRSTADTKDIDSTMWTETPAEKLQRIADEVAGVKRKKDKAGERVVGFEEEVEERRKRRREEEIRDGVRRHTEAQRGPSLLNQHTTKLAKKSKNGQDEDDQPAIWDHSRDMGVTGRLLSNEERTAKIKEAKGLGDRFGHGKSGAYNM